MTLSEERVCRICYEFGVCDWLFEYQLEKFPEGKWVCNTCTNKSAPDPTLEELLKSTQTVNNITVAYCGVCKSKRPTEIMYVSPAGLLACADCAYCTCGHLVGSHEWKHQRFGGRGDSYIGTFRVHVGKCGGKYKHWSKRHTKIRLRRCKCLVPTPIPKHLNPDEALPKTAKMDINYNTRTS